MNRMNLTTTLLAFLNFVLVFILLEFFDVDPVSFLVGCIVQAVLSVLHLFNRLY